MQTISFDPAYDYPVLSEEDPERGAKDVDVYSITAQIQPDGHACVTLARIHGARRLMVSEKLECWTVPVRSRRQALLVIQEAASRLLMDAAADTV